MDSERFSIGPMGASQPAKSESARLEWALRTIQQQEHKYATIVRLVRELLSSPHESTAWFRAEDRLQTIIAVEMEARRREEAGGA